MPSIGSQLNSNSKNIIAYFVTLDPMAYSWDQINAVFLLLGHMVSKEIGERQLHLVIQFIRTCREIALQFKFIEHIKKQLLTVLTRPLYAIAEQPKNIFVLIGYLMVLTPDDVKTFGDTFSWTKIWEVLLESSIRRSCFTFFKERVQPEIDGYVSDILFGKHVPSQSGSKPIVSMLEIGDESTSTPTPAPTPTPTPTQSVVEVQESTEQTVDRDQVVAKVFDTISNYKSYPVEWSADTDHIVQYFDVQKLSPESFKDNFHDFALFNMESLIKMSNLMENRGYPTVSSLQHCLQFVFHWRSILDGPSQQQTSNEEASYDAFKYLDSCFGVAPDDWIETIKNGARHQSDSAPTISIGNYMATVQSYYQPNNKDSLELTIQKIRAMICQGVMYRTNKVANAAADAGLFTDTSADPVRCLDEIHRQVKERYQVVMRKMETDLYFSARISSGLKSTDLSSFSVSIPHSGSPYFRDVVSQWCKKNLETEVPFAQEKLIIVLSSVRLTVDDNGNPTVYLCNNALAKQVPWRYGRKATSRFIRAWGRDKFLDIASRAQFNVYLYYKHTMEEEIL
ncbi:hypothetical protein SAMD00019534_015780 [Acytostelium subglobosum LB1]|uniref:hypothetical protein n=1 Tax=Acytostelium subglobosum LB1 TaxID=1410327 RepID=UPI000644858E|nr:hypothetical protein SAMD00019534_015780 [Acytostelium subglobosum LB1]GAM18403.1 hypothetical protein SAMD00019534_015780 [Acytostelium subglobosum LB1]|eukprot:XP_012757623.1 hypothetical protein SAMD00019534_015780 [Acytostelium subglobosum LB1]